MSSIVRRGILLGVLCMSITACGGGGGGNGGGGGGGAGALTPFAIDAAANPALAADVRNLLEVGDRFQYEPNAGAAIAIYDAIWAQLIAFATWTAGNPLYTFQFFNDTNPLTNWGRAYRYTGFSVYAGPVIAFTAGTYTSSNGTNLQAITLTTWDGNYAELLVMLNPQTIVHAIQNNNGLPIADSYTGS